MTAFIRPLSTGDGGERPSQYPPIEGVRAMGAVRKLVGRHAGVLLAIVGSSVVVGLSIVGPNGGEAARPRVVLPEHESRVAEFSPDGRVMVTDGDSGGCVRDAATGRVLARLMRPGPGGPTPATDITWPRFTADGRLLVVQLGGPRFGPKQTVTLAVFEAATGRECASFTDVGSGLWRGSLLPPAEYALSADGSRLAFSRTPDRGERRVIVWDVATERVADEFTGSPPLALAPDGGTLAHGGPAVSHGYLPTIRTLKPRRPAAARPAGPAAPAGQDAGPIAFSADGRLLVAEVGGEWHVVEVLGEAIGRVRAVVDPNSPRRSNDWFSPQAARFSPDARILLLEDIGDYSAPTRVQCWDLTGPSPRRGFWGAAGGVTPDGSVAALAERDRNSRWGSIPRDDSRVSISELPALRARPLIVETGVHEATIAPDGRIVALPSYRREAPRSNKIARLLRDISGSLGLGSGWLVGDGPAIEIREIKFYDTTTGRLVGTIDRPAKRHQLGPISFSPDGETLVVRYLPEGFRGWNSQNPMIDWSVELWDVPTGPPGARMSRLEAACAAAFLVLVLVGAWADRRRARRGAHQDAEVSEPF
jgi:WD40 repeat protein